MRRRRSVRGVRVSSRADRVDAALTAAARGLAMFGIPPGARIPAPGWQNACTTDTDEIVRLAAAGNLGVGCRASDVVGLDLDQHPGRPDGAEAFAAACTAHDAAWPDTFTVTTPAGQHLYFQAAGQPIASTSGRSTLGAGIDIRGPGQRNGGYLIAPGSLYRDQMYRVDHDAPVAPLPPWLTQFLLANLPR